MYSLLQQELLYVVISGVVGLLLMYRFRPDERRNVRLTAVFLVLGLIGYGIAQGASLMGMSRVAAIMGEVFTILLGMVIIRLWGLAIFRLLLPAIGVRVPQILEDVIVSVGYLAWGLVRLRYAGLDLSQIVTTSTIITAVLAFSMQDTLGNVLSGIALQLDSSIELGQWVKVGDISGRVVQIGWRSTQIETRNGETAVVPNAWLMKNTFSVIGKQLGELKVWRRWVYFEVDWECPPQHVMDAATQGVRDARIEFVATEPAPQAVLMELSNGVARYALRYWLTNPQVDDPTDSQVRAHVVASLLRHGFALSIHSHNVLMTKDNDKTMAAKLAKDLQARIKALSEMDLLAAASEAERTKIAEQLNFAPFETGDIITRQGAIAHWLYILTVGEVEVWKDFGTADAQMLGRLTASSFFGEMGLMTGAPRSATVVAVSYCECYKLDKAVFQQALHQRPELAEAISQVLATRLEANRNKVNNSSVAPITPHHTELLARMKHFFGLQ
ncbi:mechanosensitive ion channel family protein [Parachitinimonas caeni]|uniref:Small-conductance mechanosensitive channel n=1 Tax=Parachitinimonas caeni TaxID=3031301 RepID=A0ABT7DWR0_9NEIS|nr:mechanosensitive ion channel family protein [Parachitinimonas caeni]MDK2124424.1 mechanosensitive ion channel family protein [Parachitinimonas caeni]